MHSACSTFFSGFALLTSCAQDTIPIGDVSFVRTVYQSSAGEVALAAVDANRDGMTDVVVASQSDGEAVVLLADGSGRLTQGGGVAAGENPTHVATADLDGDGVMDLIVANHETSYVTLLRGDGEGLFAEFENSPLDVAADPHPHVALAVDMNGDQTLDLLVDQRNRNGVAVLSGRSDGTFAVPGNLIDVGGDPYLGFAVADLNGDGLMDVVTPNPDRVAVTLGSNSAEGGFVPATPVRVPSPFRIALADFNADGVPDLITTSEAAPDAVRVFWGDGNGKFHEASPSGFRLASGGKDLAVGDLNGDGFADALVSSWGGEGLAVLGGKEPRSIPLPFAGSPWGLLLVDLNGDGRDDLVVADGVAPTLTTWVSQP